MIKLEIKEINDMNYKTYYKSENTNALEHIVAISRLIYEIEKENSISRKKLFKYVKNVLKHIRYDVCESEGKDGK